MLGIDIGSFKPKFWAGLIPFGLTSVKPRHFIDMAITLLENLHNLPYAIRILKDGVCDGCALGTVGIRDFTLKGVHLCNVRLSLLKLNTMKQLKKSSLYDLGRLRKLSGKDLINLGRLPYPFIRRKGENEFNRISWDNALDIIANKIKTVQPERIAFYLTSRGISNEVYYTAQKVARFLGTNNVDNSARLCHSPSTVAMKETLGVSASTCSYTDWIGTDLLVFFGSNTPNNQPVTAKYIYYAKLKGAKVVVVNPVKEPGFDKYWIPSILESSIFGTKLCDKFFFVNTGGDIAFISGVLKHLIDNGWTDNEFIGRHTSGFTELESYISSLSWELIEKASGVTRAELLEFARMYAASKSSVFVWSMGLTHHSFGTDNVKAVVNLGLSRGNIGRPKTGFVPIRGHSGVQGGAEVGCVPDKLPGGLSVDKENTGKLKEIWDFDPPLAKGLNAVEMITEAYKGNIDVLYSSGGNFIDTLPDPELVKDALKQVNLRVHQDIVLTTQMLVDPKDVVILLPAATRYEQRGGATETSTERRILFSPQIPGRKVGEARSEWEIFVDLAKRVRPESSHLIDLKSGQQIRTEISEAVPFYKGIETLYKKGDMIQYGGERLCDGYKFGTMDGKAHFSVCKVPQELPGSGRFRLSNRRGKQFNSIIQRNTDPLTGRKRLEIFINSLDAKILSLKDGSCVVVRNDSGSLRAFVRISDIQKGNVQMFWPESNVLLKFGNTDPACGVPDYNAYVDIMPLEKKF
ncbi:MAG: FdhF/YdeP family oxidoreductase [Planctomycetes bacterium]|nr:FdhF/YdeP family oxidoreductase [Planctomycetota bacterium]